MFSGATESNNLALLGLKRFGEASNRRHILSTAIEHKAVLEPLEQLSAAGFEVELAPVTSGGYVEPDEIRRRLRPDTLLVSVKIHLGLTLTRDEQAMERDNLRLA